MPKKNRGLGRGLDALLPETELTSGAQDIDIGELDPNPNQPRREFSPAGIQALAESIRAQGILQPILAVPTDNGRYRIVAGERRYRAAREAGLETVPVIVRDLDSTQQMEIALIENLQREDLNPMEAAQGIRSLMDQCGYTQEQAAQRLGKSRPAVANLLRLLSLPEEIQAMVERGDLSAGHARVLAGISGAERQLTLARKTVEEGLSVRELERLASEERQPAKSARAKTEPTAEMKDFEHRLCLLTGLKVSIKGTESRGRITLPYRSAEELQRLWELVQQTEEG